MLVQRRACRRRRSHSACNRRHQLTRRPGSRDKTGSLRRRPTRRVCCLISPRRESLSVASIARCRTLNATRGTRSLLCLLALVGTTPANSRPLSLAVPDASTHPDVAPDPLSLIPPPATAAAATAAAAAAAAAAGPAADTGTCPPHPGYFQEMCIRCGAHRVRPRRDVGEERVGVDQVQFSCVAAQVPVNWLLQGPPPAQHRHLCSLDLASPALGADMSGSPSCSRAKPQRA